MCINILFLSLTLLMILTLDSHPSHLALHDCVWTFEIHGFINFPQFCWSKGSVSTSAGLLGNEPHLILNNDHKDSSAWGYGEGGECPPKGLEQNKSQGTLPSALLKNRFHRHIHQCLCKRGSHRCLPSLCNCFYS